MGERKKENPKHTQRRMSAAQKRKFIALAGLAFLCALLFLCSSVLNMHTSTKKEQCQPYVIHDKDQQPHIKEQHNASENT